MSKFKKAGAKVKLSDKQVKEVMVMLGDQLDIGDIAKMYGVQRTMIKNILSASDRFSILIGSTDYITMKKKRLKGNKVIGSIGKKQKMIKLESFSQFVLNEIYTELHIPGKKLSELSSKYRVSESSLSKFKHDKMIKVKGKMLFTLSPITLFNLLSEENIIFKKRLEDILNNGSVEHKEIVIILCRPSVDLKSSIHNLGIALTLITDYSITEITLYIESLLKKLGEFNVRYQN